MTVLRFGLNYLLQSGCDLVLRPINAYLCFVEDSPHPETALRFIDIALVGLRRR